MDTAALRLDLAFAALHQESHQGEFHVISCPISLIQRWFKLSYANAAAIITSLEQMGFLERLDDTSVILGSHCVQRG